MKTSKPIVRKKPLKRTGIARDTSQLTRTQPLTTAPLTPGKRPRKAMKRRRATPRKWEDLPSRRAYKKSHPFCEYASLPGWNCTCTENDVLDIEHAFGRRWIGADDAKHIICLRRPCHDRIGRGVPARVNMLWIKLQGIQEQVVHDLSAAYGVVSCIDWETAVRQRMWLVVEHIERGARWHSTELQNWKKDVRLSMEVRERVGDIMLRLGIGTDE